MDNLVVGSVINGRYRLERQLGSGGFGMVYLARDQQLRDRPVVVKILQEKVVADPWFQRKFSQEVEALSRIHHPSVVSVIDRGELPSGQPFMVQQFVEGETLRHHIQPGGMDLARVARILRRTGQALTAAHERGIFHRDLKPENIMLQSVAKGEEHVTLIDFGIASVMDSEIGDIEKTKVTGTFTYMAPEQFDGRPVAASDTYALAVIAYEMLAGVPPSKGRPLFEVMLMQKEGSWPRISELRPSVRLDAQEAILRALSFQPPERFGSAQEFGETVADALEQPVVDSIGDMYHVPQPPTISGRTLVWILTLTVVVALSATALIWTRRNEGRFVPAAPKPAPVASAAKRLQLAYWVSVQPVKNAKPAGDAFVLSHERTFHAGDHIFFTFSSERSGYLYIFNQDPVLRGGIPTYSVLFPTPTANSGEAKLDADEPVRIPGGDYFVFDRQQGVERIWMVWSEREIAELSGIKASPKGLSPTGQRRVGLFLTDHEPARPSVEISEARMRTILTGSGPVLVHRIDFTHAP
jgi:serine/threonine protein kinase